MFYVGRAKSGEMFNWTHNKWSSQNFGLNSKLSNETFWKNSSWKLSKNLSPIYKITKTMALSAYCEKSVACAKIKKFQLEDPFTVEELSNNILMEESEFVFPKNCVSRPRPVSINYKIGVFRLSKFWRKRLAIFVEKSFVCEKLLVTTFPRWIKQVLQKKHAFEGRDMSTLSEL